MTPTLSELLTGNFMTFMAPAPEENAGDFTAAKIGVTGMIALLGAQEAERGPAARRAENAAIRQLLADAASHGVRASAADEGDGSISALDAANAELRRGLIALHEAAERADDTALDRRILALYRLMAEWRRLDLPAMPAS